MPDHETGMRRENKLVHSLSVRLFMFCQSVISITLCLPWMALGFLLKFGFDLFSLIKPNQGIFQTLSVEEQIACLKFKHFNISFRTKTGKQLVGITQPKNRPSRAM